MLKMNDLVTRVTIVSRKGIAPLFTVSKTVVLSVGRPTRSETWIRTTIAGFRNHLPTVRRSRKCWKTWIRTKIKGVKGLLPTVRRSSNILFF